ncbi:MAG: PQQ-binding-like beta-propeller repeat protein [Eubacteriales bacterium]
MSNSMYVKYDNQYQRPKKRKQNNGFVALIALTLVLLLTVFGVLLYSLVPRDDLSDTSSASTAVTDANGAVTNASIIISTPSPAPVESIAPNQNSVLYPAAALVNVPMGQPAKGLSPSERGLTQSVLSGDTEIAPYLRANAIAFGDPLNYQSVPGILTFRGNNFRNCASWGTVAANPTTLAQVWEYNSIGTLSSSSWAFSWMGTGWTGQPLAIQWDFDLQQKMNMYPDKKAKQGLTEIIIAAMDGKVYFFDLEDGKPTRDPINVGATIKGTPALDPRGYPILYVGQGDSNGVAGTAAEGKIGYRIYSLIDSSLMFFQDGMDSRAYRTTWGACDSSPIINAASDTLIYPNENGMIYTVKLNTAFDKAAGTVSINPESVVFRYLIDGITGSEIGIESSMSIYDHYGYCSDNSGNLLCIDLNTLQIVWVRQLDDDSDVTPVIEEEDGRVYLYMGTEVDWQKKDVLDYQGASYTYKIDAMTGEEIWQTSYSCFTHNGADKGDDVNGGMLGTPIVGKKSISDLVIFSYCMTNGIYSGNHLVAYNKNTGDKVWDYSMNQYSWSSPVDVYDADGNAYIVICDSVGQIHLVNGLTGARITYLQLIKNKGLAGENKNAQNIESSPIVINGMIVIGTRGSSIYGVSIK